MVLGSTQPLVKMSTRNISWGQRQPVREADDLTTCICRMSWKSGILNFLGTLWATPGLLRESFNFFNKNNFFISRFSFTQYQKEFLSQLPVNVRSLSLVVHICCTRLIFLQLRNQQEVDCNSHYLCPWYRHFKIK